MMFNIVPEIGDYKCEYCSKLGKDIEVHTYINKVIPLYICKECFDMYTKAYNLVKSIEGKYNNRIEIELKKQKRIL